MNNLSLMRFLVHKYFLGSATHTTLRTMGIISWLSIAITTFTLSLQIFIAQGFEEALKDKMQNIYPDIIISAPEDQSFNFIATQSMLYKKHPEISCCAPSHSKPALLKKNDIFSQEVVTLKAIDPTSENRVCNIEKKLVHETYLQDLQQHKGIIIGTTLAANHDIKKNDSITLLLQEEDEKIISVPLKVVGFIETGINYYDAHLVICSLQTFYTLFHDETISAISIRLHDKNKSKDILETLTKTYGFHANTWQTLYPALVQASELEKRVGTLLLALMVLVACTTIAGFIFMHIILKKKDIALLKIRGFSHTAISLIFVLLGMIVTTTACFSGLTTALAAGYALEKYKLFALPDVYDVQHIPVVITFDSLLFIVTIVTSLGLIASLLAVYQIKNINASYALRFEE